MDEALIVQPLFDPSLEEWVIPVGRYIMNMGSVEMATRLLIAQIQGTHITPVFNAALDSRIGFIRNRFPRKDKTRHEWAMNVLTVAKKHSDFRNIIAHSPLVVTGHADGINRIQGIMNMTSDEIVSLQEMKGRVEESAVLASKLLEMQSDFRRPGKLKHVVPAI